MKYNIKSEDGSTNINLIADETITHVVYLKEKKVTLGSLDKDYSVLKGFFVGVWTSLLLVFTVLSFVLYLLK